MFKVKFKKEDDKQKDQRWNENLGNFSGHFNDKCKSITPAQFWKDEKTHERKITKRTETDLNQASNTNILIDVTNEEQLYATIKTSPIKRHLQNDVWKRRQNTLTSTDQPTHSEKGNLRTA